MIGLAIGAYDGWQTPLLFIGVCLVVGFWLAALLDIFRHTFQHKNQKVLWVLVVLLFPVVGSLIYLFLGRKQKIH